MRAGAGPAAFNSERSRVAPWPRSPVDAPPKAPGGNLRLSPSLWTAVEQSLDVEAGRECPGVEER